MKHIYKLLFLLLLFSCSDNDFEPIDVSNTLSLAMSSQYAVIINPYASYYLESNANSEILTYGRVGDVVEVTGSTINNDDELWYNFEDGWLSESALRIYANKLQAEYAAKDYAIE